MNLLTKLATLLLKAAKPVAVSIVAKAVASDKVKLSREDVVDAIKAEGARQVGKRLGG